MAEFTSTRSNQCKATAYEAVLNGIAPDGGLYVPTCFPQIPLSAVLSLSYPALAQTIIKKMLPSFTEEEVGQSAREAYAHFDSPAVCPLVPVGGSFVLELFHGETAAFKDIALSILPRLLTRARRALGRQEKVLILTATSGDTGSAAMNGFRDVDGTGIITFYPYGGTSAIQRQQMVSMAGSNLAACAVKGNFDDCQTAVKRAFAELTPPEGIIFSSANSINIARLVPQIAYYFSAYAQLVNEHGITPGTSVDFIVPTGNFGDILAGFYAWKMGLPVGKLVCASNANRVLTDFIATGVYDRRREFRKTLSPSMDILISSNLERLIYHAEGSAEAVSSLMAALKNEGVYRVSDAALSFIQERFCAYSFDDNATLATMQRVFNETGYLPDPHTAVGFASLYAHKQVHPHSVCVVLSTASPFKFPESACDALGLRKNGDAFELLGKVSEKIHVQAPAVLSVLKGAPIRHPDVIELNDIFPYIQGKAATLCQA